MGFTDLVGQEQIAYPYVATADTPLMGGVGVVPGGDYEPLYQDNLIAGRGLVPGVGNLPVSLGLVKHKVYPDYDTYSGNAHRATLKFYSLRVPFGENIINWLTTEAVEAQTWIGGGKMLELSIWSYEDTWNYIPVYEWTIEWVYYDRDLALGEQRAAVPIVALVLAVIGLFIVYLIMGKVVDVIWGPGNGNGGAISRFTSLALVGGGLYLGFLALTRKKKK